MYKNILLKFSVLPLNTVSMDIVDNLGARWTFFNNQIFPGSEILFTHTLSMSEQDLWEVEISQVSIFILDLL